MCELQFTDYAVIAAMVLIPTTIMIWIGTMLISEEKFLWKSGIEITDEEYALFEKLKKVWVHSQPEKTGSFFICGEGGEKDAHGLPDIILVCPHMGVNTTAIYRKEKVGKSGQ